MQQPALVPSARSWAPRPAGGSRLLLALVAVVLESLHAERPRWPLWAPIAFAVGILVYFALPVEPSPRLLALVPLGVIGAIAGARRAAGLAVLFWLGLALALAGFAVAQLRTLQVAAPVLPRSGVYHVEGVIRAAEPRNDGQRLLLGDLVIERLEEAATPALVRFTVRRTEVPFLPGQRIKARARLQPPSGAAVPGGFDFAMRAWFERLGGVGFALGAPELLAAGPGTGTRPIATLRHAVAARAERIIPGADGAVAAALLTGLRASIPDRVWHDMQASGLAHLLAISGLHMTLIAGTVFVVARALFALWPALALRVVPKKPAAVVALLAALGYLLLAGATVPTQRAFMMAAVALLAVLLDRNPVSMRLLAMAAFVVLVIAPESLLGPSFQMSFAAVTGLVAFYELRLGQLALTPPENDRQRPARLLLVYFIGILVTTLIASLATTPFAAYHFQRVATYGVLANLVAVPLTAFWIMPAGLLALLLMPFGLDAPILHVMGAGIGIVLDVAAFVAALPGAGIDVSPWPPSSLLLLALGGLWLCLWRQYWRLWGGCLYPGYRPGPDHTAAGPPGRPTGRSRRLSRCRRRSSPARAEARPLARRAARASRRLRRGERLRNTVGRAAGLRSAGLCRRPRAGPPGGHRADRRGGRGGLRPGPVRPAARRPGELRQWHAEPGRAHPLAERRGGAHDRGRAGAGRNRGRLGGRPAMDALRHHCG